MATGKSIVAKIKFILTYTKASLQKPPQTNLSGGAGATCTPQAPKSALSTSKQQLDRTIEDDGHLRYHNYNVSHMERNGCYPPSPQKLDKVNPIVSNEYGHTNSHVISHHVIPHHCQPIVIESAISHSSPRQSRYNATPYSYSSASKQNKSESDAAASQQNARESSGTVSQSIISDVLAGSCAGIAITLVGHPLDTVKTRLQAQSAHRSYTGIWDCIAQTTKQEGLRGFYKGSASPFSMYVLYSSIYYSSYFQARRYLGIADRNSPAPSHLILASTIITGISSTIVRTPMDLLKTQAQTINSHKGTLRLGMEILRENGISSLFQGFQPTLARQIVGSFAWFYSYEYMKQRTRDDSASLFLCGGFASWVYWTVVYPIDSIKTRIQADAICGKQSRQYKGWIHCFLSTLRNESYRGLFRGFSACMLRAFPANATGIVVFELVRKSMMDNLID